MHSRNHLSTCLLLALFALALAFGGCGGGGSTGSPETRAASSTPMTYAQRAAARKLVIDKLATLRALSLPDQNKALVSYITTLSQFEAAGQGADGAVWARYRDGRVYVIANNAPGSPPKGLAADLPQRHKAAVRPGLPTSQHACLMRSMGTGYPNSVSVIEPWLADAGYVVETPAATLDHLMTVKDDGIFYMHGHGGSGHTRDAAVNYGLWTATVISAANDVKYDDLIAEGSVFEMTAGQNEDPITHAPIVESHYAITASFVTKYMSFGSNSFVLIHGCNGDDAAFKAACLAKGASLYAGWTKPVMSDDSARATRFCIDRMLGANHYNPLEAPPQRPFDYASVASDLKRLGWNTSDGGFGTATFVFTAGTGDMGLLDPSIRFLTVDEVNGGGKPKLSIDGLFGADPGAANRKVTVGATPLKVTSWKATKIDCELPATGPGACGDTIVEVRGHKSNKVPLTQWVAKFHYTFEYNKGTLMDTMDMEYHVRADIHSHRDTPHVAPLAPVLTFVCSPGSTGTCSASGTYTDSSHHVTTYSGSGSFAFSSNYASVMSLQSPGLLAYGTIDAAQKTMRIYMWATGTGKIITEQGVSTASPIGTMGMFAFDGFGGGVYPPQNIILPFPYVDLKLNSNYGIIAGQGKGVGVDSSGHRMKVTWTAAAATDPPVPSVTTSSAAR